MVLLEKKQVCTYAENNYEDCLGPCQTSMMERFCGNSSWLLAGKDLHKKAPSWMFDRVLNTLLKVTITYLILMQNK